MLCSKSAAITSLQNDPEKTFLHFPDTGSVQVVYSFTLSFVTDFRWKAAGNRTISAIRLSLNFPLWAHGKTNNKNLIKNPRESSIAEVQQRSEVWPLLIRHSRNGKCTILSSPSPHCEAQCRLDSWPERWSVRAPSLPTSFVYILPRSSSSSSLSLS